MAKLHDRTRDAILTAARAGDYSRRQIARDLGVSASTVSRVCRDAGLPSANTRTVEAVQTRTLNARERRAHLSSQTLDDIDVARMELYRSATPRDLADAAKAVSLLVNAHARIATLDSTTEAQDNARSVLGGIASALGFSPTGADE